MSLIAAYAAVELRQKQRIVADVASVLAHPDYNSVDERLRRYIELARVKPRMHTAG